MTSGNGAVNSDCTWVQLSRVQTHTNPASLSCVLHTQKPCHNTAFRHTLMVDVHVVRIILSITAFSCLHVAAALSTCANSIFNLTTAMAGQATPAQVTAKHAVRQMRVIHPHSTHFICCVYSNRQTQVQLCLRETRCSGWVKVLKRVSSQKQANP